jgi:Na+-driven multidrug efflux pump
MENNKIQTRSQMLEKERVGRLLFNLSVPAIIGMMVHAFYNIVDTIFVGRYTGPLGIGGIAIVFPIQMIMMSSGMAIGIGGASVISRRMGEGDQKGASLTLGNMVLLSLSGGLFCSVIGFIFLDPLLTLFGANEALLPYSKSYLSIIVSSIFLLQYFLSGKSELSFHYRYMRFDLSIVKEVIAVGLSDFFRSVAMSLTSALVNNALRRLGGEIPIAAFGIIFRSLSIFFMPMMGIAQGVQPIIGFNFGANQLDRVRKGLRLANISTTMIACFGFLVFFLFPRQIFRIFSDNHELISMGIEAIRLFIFSLPVLGYQHIAISLFQALGRARPALFLSIFRQILFLIPLVLVLPRFFGLKGIWLSFPVSDFISFFITFIMVTQLLRSFPAIKRAS